MAEIQETNSQPDLRFNTERAQLRPLVKLYSWGVDKKALLEAKGQAFLQFGEKLFAAQLDCSVSSFMGKPARVSLRAKDEIIASLSSAIEQLDQVEKIKADKTILIVIGSDQEEIKAGLIELAKKTNLMAVSNLDDGRLLVGMPSAEILAGIFCSTPAINQRRNIPPFIAERLSSDEQEKTARELAEQWQTTLIEAVTSSSKM